MHLRRLMLPCTALGGSPGRHNFCWGCYLNLKARNTCPGHFYSSLSQARKIPYRCFPMKRPKAIERNKPGNWHCPDAKFLETYPTLAAFMCDPWWDDGKIRILPSLSLRFEDGHVKLCLADKHANCGAYTDASTLDEALGLLDAALAMDAVEWRRWGKK